MTSPKFLILATLIAIAAAKTHTFHGKGWWLETVGQENPRYRFGLDKNETSTRYQVEFNKLFEVVWDGKKDEYVGANNDMFSLNSLAWVITDPQNETDGIVFNLTTGPAQCHVAGFKSLTFRTHIRTKASTSSTILKFDVIISGYVWADAEAKLAIVAKVIAQGRDWDGRVHGDDEIDLGGAKLRSAKKAKAGQKSTTNAQLWKSSGKTYFLIYDHFTGDLEHDPEVTFIGGLPGFAIFAIVLAILVTIGVGVLLFVILRRAYGGKNWSKV